MKKTIKEKVLMLMLVMCFIIGGLCVFGEKAHAEATKTIKYKKQLSVSMMYSNELAEVDLGKLGKGAKSISIKSSKKSIAAPEVDEYIVLKKPGKTKLTITVKKKNGSKKKYTCQMTVYKYKNPFKSIKLGSNNLKGSFKESDYANASVGKKAKINITPAKGWTIKKINYSATKGSKKSNKTYRNKKTISFKGGEWYESINIVMYNKSKNLYEKFTVEPWIN